MTYFNTSKDRETAKLRKKELYAQLTQEQKERLAEIPDIQKYLFLKVWVGKSSLPEKIKAKCLDCSCYQKEEVVNCVINLCPLYTIRPYQKKD